MLSIYIDCTLWKSAHWDEREIIMGCLAIRVLLLLLMWVMLRCVTAWNVASEMLPAIRRIVIQSAICKEMLKQRKMNGSINARCKTNMRFIMLQKTWMSHFLEERSCVMGYNGRRTGRLHACSAASSARSRADAGARWYKGRPRASHSGGAGAMMEGIIIWRWSPLSCKKTALESRSFCLLPADIQLCCCSSWFCN